VDVLSETWSWVLSVVGWDNLTPQRHRFGIAAILALLALTPGRPSGLLSLHQLHLQHSWATAGYRFGSG